ncbi:MotA/TolQ/ExbB proton channel family protein [Thalassospira sp. HF15]|uniref:MotA/TolQ/ExbB proton channel family protein n=1 Tax=Thalassospira sp. HF15 TaxID=2722755 RepID=UPI00142FEFE6|nr:MotA/TolQ/ExbB proton channel family protein [Thalassospira sp. HF15]NIY77840.1 MotA/TolQ/ExbB proton channel family protein [Thalassospira sp. HF15]
MSDPVNSSAASRDAETQLLPDGAQADGGVATGTLNADGSVLVNPHTGLAVNTNATIQSNGLLDGFTSLPVIEQVDRAGVVGWVLAAMALIGLLVFFYKLVGFLRRGVFADGFVKDVERHLSSGDQAQASELLARRRHPAARIGLSGMSLPVNSAQDREAASDLIAVRARKEIDGLNGGLRIMSAIAVLSPLLGLLGTVMGMIEAFQRMEGAGSRIDPSVLSGGIWLALLTTAIGLVVAIPATAFHMWMQGVIGRAAATMEDVCTLVVNRGELARKTVHHASNISELRHAAE